MPNSAASLKFRASIASLPFASTVSLHSGVFLFAKANALHEDVGTRLIKVPCHDVAEEVRILRGHDRETARDICAVDIVRALARAIMLDDAEGETVLVKLRTRKRGRFGRHLDNIREPCPGDRITTTDQGFHQPGNRFRR